MHPLADVAVTVAGQSKLTVEAANTDKVQKTKDNKASNLVNLAIGIKMTVLIAPLYSITKKASA